MLDRRVMRDPSITLALMHIDTLTGPEQRVLGCLIEKRFTTPEQYPLTLNALRLACNQSTNRDPVVNYDEDTVREAAQRLARYGLARLASGHSSRATKYRHLAEEALALSREQLAVLAVLLLRGPQTPGELKGRTERIVQWPSLAEVELVLAAMIERGFVWRMDRRPGQKEERFAQVLGGAPGDAPTEPLQSPVIAAAPNTPIVPTPPMAPAGVVGTAGDPLITRLNALEARVEQLATLLEELTGESLR
jgi:uncharacterized protein